MKMLEDRIRKDGIVREGNVLKVDSFINHQMDIPLFREMAREWKRLFAGKPINKVLTIEASGIAPAIMLGYIRQLPVVFIKKKQPSTMDGMLISEVHSFTKDRTYTVCISRNFLTPSDRVIFIDDFLAYGNAAMGMIDLARQSGASIAGMGFIIEKGFQGGGDRLRQMGYNIQSLAIVDSLDGCRITLREQ